MEGTQRMEGKGKRGKRKEGKREGKEGGERDKIPKWHLFSHLQP